MLKQNSEITDSDEAATVPAKATLKPSEGSSRKVSLSFPKINHNFLTKTAVHETDFLKTE